MSSAMAYGKDLSVFLSKFSGVTDLVINEINETYKYNIP